MYSMYFNKWWIPVIPDKITMKINGNNKTVNLINNGEVNIIKPAGLTDIEFDLLIPNVKYPFVPHGPGGFKSAYYHLGRLERYKKKKKPFSFTVYRELPNKRKLFSTSILVTLEDYTIKEDVKEGFDVVVSVKLKQYVSYGVKKIKLVTNKDGTVSIKQTVSRVNQSDKISVPTTHKVTENDTIWSLAKYYYGDGLKYSPIWNANKDKLTDPENLIVGSTLTIPSLKE
ncbi:MAG: LysM peptidoglycan-binding domain-containing protein [Lachnotalea sp.]